MSTRFDREIAALQQSTLLLRAQYDEYTWANRYPRQTMLDEIKHHRRVLRILRQQSYQRAFALRYGRATEDIRILQSLFDFHMRCLVGAGLNFTNEIQQYTDLLTAFDERLAEH